jgi:hypothetical protein
MINSVYLNDQGNMIDEACNKNRTKSDFHVCTLSLSVTSKDTMIRCLYRNDYVVFQTTVTFFAVGSLFLFLLMMMLLMSLMMFMCKFKFMFIVDDNVLVIFVLLAAAACVCAPRMGLATQPAAIAHPRSGTAPCPPSHLCRALEIKP